MSKRLYRPGRRIKTMSLLSRELLAGRYVWYFGRPCHPSWLASMQWNTLRGMVQSGRLRLAVRNAT